MAQASCADVKHNTHSTSLIAYIIGIYICNYSVLYFIKIYLDKYLQLKPITIKDADCVMDRKLQLKHVVRLMSMGNIVSICNQIQFNNIG